MSMIRGGSRGHAGTDVMASREGGAAEGGRDGDSGGGERGRATLLQGPDIFAFFFTHGLRFGVCNASGALRSGAAVSYWRWDLPVEYDLTCGCSWTGAIRWGTLWNRCIVQFGGII